MGRCWNLGVRGGGFEGRRFIYFFKECNSHSISTGLVSIMVIDTEPRHP